MLIPGHHITYHGQNPTRVCCGKSRIINVSEQLRRNHKQINILDLILQPPTQPQKPNPVPSLEDEESTSLLLVDSVLLAIKLQVKCTTSISMRYASLSISSVSRRRTTGYLGWVGFCM